VVLPRPTHTFRAKRCFCFLFLNRFINRLSTIGRVTHTRPNQNNICSISLVFFLRHCSQCVVSFSFFRDTIYFVYLCNVRVTCEVVASRVCKNWLRGSFDESSKFIRTRIVESHIECVLFRNSFVRGILLLQA